MGSPGWGPGWPAGATGPVATVVCGASGLRLPVRVEIAPLVAGLVAELETARGEPFRPDWSWGYANRPIAGTSSPSNHSRGTAVDLDAPTNPYLSAGEHRRAHPLRKEIAGRLLRTTMPAGVVGIADRWGFGWGGLYASKPDPMHFELALTPLGAAARIADLRALDGRPVPDHPWPWEADVPQPSDVVARIPLPAELALDENAHLLMRADGTIEFHGAKPKVVDAGHYQRLKPEHRSGDRWFGAGGLWLGDEQRRMGRGFYFTQMANDGKLYRFGPSTKPMLVA